ncbi:MAG TPA: carbohydrate-binding family 9-like protein [Sphingobacteriaceae bacterium]
MNLKIPYIKDLAGPDLLSASLFLDTLSKNYITNVPWPQYKNKPDVSFAICYTDENILLKYYVHEDSFRALYKTHNDPVYKDSCVEVFISFDESGYYNLEFNSLGTCLAAFGKNRNERTPLSKEIIEQIKSQTLITAESNRSGQFIQWELTLIIPFGTFYNHHFTSLKNQVCSVNFYKCGDELPEPHYLAWNNIISKEPDFHLPQYFGKAEFI